MWSVWQKFQSKNISKDHSEKAPNMEPVYECPRGYHKYSKPVSEIVQAASKHREAALSLKEIGDKQKIKLKE